MDISTGQVIGALHSRHRASEFKKFLQAIDRDQILDSIARYCERIIESRH